jgi:hypothetical protein
MWMVTINGDKLRKSSADFWLLLLILSASTRSGLGSTAKLLNKEVSSATCLVQWLQELFIALGAQPLTTVGLAAGMLGAAIRASSAA